jgi:hypothetical protein
MDIPSVHGMYMGDWGTHHVHCTAIVRTCEPVVVRHLNIHCDAPYTGHLHGDTDDFQASRMRVCGGYDKCDLNNASSFRTQWVMMSTKASSHTMLSAR